jgi:dCTP deaminase
MGLKPDHWIRKMALDQGMIEPFVEKQVREGVISFGVSPQEFYAEFVCRY